MMKKIRKPIALLLSVLMLLTLFAPLGVVSFAQGDIAEAPEGDIVTIVETGDCGADGSDVKYTLYSDGTFVISGSGEIADYAFGSEWASEQVRQQNVKLPWKLIVEDGITAIGKWAFHSTLHARSSVKLADSVKTIGEWAFSECDFASFDFGSVERLESHAFYNVGLLEINLPQTLKYVGDQNFEATLLTNKRVIFGKNVEFIDKYTLFASNVEEVILQNGNTEIGIVEGGCTFNCHGTCQKIYSYVGSPAEAYAIANECTFVDLATYHEYDDGVITTPATCGEDGVKTFTCTLCGESYTETIPATGHDWGDWMIAQNSTNTEPGLAQRVCLTNSSHTETFAIPAYGPAVEIGECGQDGDPVYYIVYEDGTLLITGTGAIRNDMFNSGYVPVSGNVHVSENVRNTNRLIIEDGVTAIGGNAFAFLHFNSIDFGNTLVSIGLGAFYDNDGFETVVLPDSVKTVGDGAFALSSYLKTVTFGPNVETVGDWALLQCYKLQKVVFLNKDTQIVELEHSGNTVLHTVNSGTIYGYSGGAVEAYAREKGLRFVPLDSSGHAYNGGAITTPATCEADGVKTFTCEICGESYTEAIPAAGHNWSEWIVTRPATETREGEAYRFCKNDPSHVEYMTIDKLPTTYENDKNIGERILDWIRDFFEKIGEFFTNLFNFW